MYVHDMYICTQVYIKIYVYTYVSMYMHIFIHPYICVCVCTRECVSAVTFLVVLRCSMLTFAHADIRAPRSGTVEQIEFNDAGTVVSACDDGTTRFWDVATGAQKEEIPGERFAFSKGGPSDKQMAGKYVVTKQGDLVEVYLTDTAITSANEKAEQNKKPVAFFRAPAPIQTLQCAGDKISVGCVNGEVLHLRAAFLVT